MKSFTCGDVVPGCKKVFHSESEEAILAGVAEHAITDHGLMSVPDELVAAVRAKIIDVAS